MCAKMYDSQSADIHLQILPSLQPLPAVTKPRGETEESGGVGRRTRRVGEEIERDGGRYGEDAGRDGERWGEEIEKRCREMGKRRGKGKTQTTPFLLTIPSFL